MEWIEGQDNPIGANSLAYGIGRPAHLSAMTKALSVLCLLLALTLAVLHYRERPAAVPSLPKPTPTSISAEDEIERKALHARLSAQAQRGLAYATAHGLSTRVAFLVDMQRHSGKKRFFIYDLQADTVRSAGLVAHGSCNRNWLPDAAFGNEPGCGCSSLGRYKVGYAYPGRFGTAFKLYGLDRSNSNAFDRFVVLHAYDCIPDTEIYPRNVCNSLGCPMVSYRFLATAATAIRQEKKPILLWIFN